MLSVAEVLGVFLFHGSLKMDWIYELQEPKSTVSVTRKKI